MTPKTCAPSTRAGMNGASTVVESADLPRTADHAPTVAVLPPANNRRRLLIVWRNGLPPVPPEQLTLTALQFAFVMHNAETPES